MLEAARSHPRRNRRGQTAGARAGTPARSPPVSPSRATFRKWLAAGAKLLVVLVVLWFVRRTLRDAWDQLGQDRWQFHFGWLMAAGGVYLAGLLPPALFWHRVLRVLGQSPLLSESIRSYYVSHLGKYVPGKAMVIVIRAGLVRSGRVHAGVAAVGVFLETLTMMAAGAAVALAILAVQFRGNAWLMALALGLMVLSGLPTLPPVFRVLARLARVGRSDPAVRAQLARFGLGTLLAGWAYMIVCWIVLGASLWLTLLGMGVEGLDLAGQLALCTATVALAVVAGFLSLIPGGVVVREAVLLALLAPHFGNAVAVASAVVLRVVWLVAELAVSAILYACGTRWGRSPAAPLVPP